MNCDLVITFSFTPCLADQQSYYWDYAADARVPFQNMYPDRICTVCVILLKLQYLISSSKMYLVYNVGPSGHSMKSLRSLIDQLEAAAFNQNLIKIGKLQFTHANSGHILLRV